MYLEYVVVCLASHWTLELGHYTDSVCHMCISEVYA